jgi:hypothetical protein
MYTNMETVDTIKNVKFFMKREKKNLRVKYFFFIL